MHARALGLDLKEDGKVDLDETGISTLREVLDWVIQEHLAEKKTKRELSHDLANRFLYTLRPWVRSVEEPRGNANYFLVEIDGVKLAVTPFGSHEEWWEKPSKGFRELVARERCKWGVVLFDLPKKEGLWIDGPEFDASILKGREKVNSSEVRQAKKMRIANAFSESSEFIEFIRNPPKKPGDSYLIRKSR
jgi:hypothetical protein